MAGRLITPGIQGQCGEGRCYEQQAHAFGVARNKWKSEIPHRVADQHRWLQADDLGEEKGPPSGTIHSHKVPAPAKAATRFSGRCGPLVCMA